MVFRIKKVLKGVIAFSVIVLATFNSANAQLGDAGEILRASASDAEVFLGEYLSPFTNGFGAGLNTGWFTTANAHQTLGFELNVNASMAFVPASALSMDVSSLGLEALEVTSGSNTTPTISGETSTNTSLGQYYTDPRTNQEEILFEFDAPAGVGIDFVPAPMGQLTVGVIKSTDISLRYIPDTEIGDFGQLGLFGFGLKHGINQWLPGGKVIPVDLSVQFGYTSFKMSADFDVDPQVNSDTYDPYSSTQWDGQGLDFETTAYTVNAIVGKKLPLIAVYGGIGIESSTSSITTPGSYPVTRPATPDDQQQYPNEIYHPQNNPNGATQIVTSVDAPIDIEIEGENSFRAFAGFRVKLAVIQLFANYTLSTYSSANAGIGITFR